jgi:CubicO group peptidase (beta-lactamase class C family)
MTDEVRQAIESAFRENFATRGEVGASVAVWENGREALSLADGFCDRQLTRPWTEATPVLVWSATKGPAAACVLHSLHARGIPLDTPVAALWPGFAQADKGRITLAELLSHRAGLAALAEPVPVEDHDAVVAALEQQPALGTGHAYHPRTFGFLLDELVRRINDGQALGDYFREHFGDPLDLEIWIGVPAERAEDVSPVFAAKAGPNPRDTEFARAFADPQSLTARAFASPRGLSSVASMNRPETRMMSLPGFGGIATARALAKFYDALLRAPFLDWMTAQLASGPDRVLQVETAFSAGFMLDPLDAAGGKVRRTFGPSPSAFGYAGAGGSVAFADPERGLSFAYVMNQMEQGVLPGPKAAALVDALGA